MLGAVHSRRYTNVLSWEWVGCKGYVGGNRREMCFPLQYPPLTTISLLSVAHERQDGGPVPVARVTNSQDEACGADVDKRHALSAGVDAS